MNIHLDAIIDYLWSDELRNFEELFGIEIQSQDTLEQLIHAVDTQEDLERRTMMQEHIFYHLLKIKQMK